MNKFQSELKAKLHTVILIAGKDGMEYLKGDINETEYRMRQQILEDMAYAYIAGLEPKHESEVV